MKFPKITELQNATKNEKRGDKSKHHSETNARNIKTDQYEYLI